MSPWQTALFRRQSHTSICSDIQGLLVVHACTEHHLRTVSNLSASTAMRYRAQLQHLLNLCVEKIGAWQS